MRTCDAESLPYSVKPGAALSHADMVAWLATDQGDSLAHLFSAARQVRARHFGNKVFLYGFIYLSTWCRNNCNFCGYRQANQRAIRYRKTKEEILAIGDSLVKSGVHLLDLTMGEDPQFSGDDFRDYVELVQILRAKYRIPLMISPGVVPGEVVKKCARSGADWYALYQETYNRRLFAQLRVAQDYDVRMQAKLIAAEHGLLVEEGIMVGVGESLADIADAIINMRQVNPKQVRVMSFVPQENTPMGGIVYNNRLMEQKVIALLRLQYPELLIPASLDIDGISGLPERLAAGANVVTSIIPPNSGLAGVAQSVKDIHDGSRTVDSVKPVLRTMGLRPASNGEYQAVLTAYKKAAADQPAPLQRENC